MKDLILLPVVLELFDGAANTNVTTDGDLSTEMKTYYSDYLIDLAEPELVHDQFGQKHPIPKNGGKIIEFRQYDPLPEMTAPLTEGVSPDGQSMSVKAITAEVKQYGGYVTLSDLLMLTAIDNNLVQATKLIASQAGRTLDTITREVINAGTVVQFADGKVDSRDELYYTSAEDNCNLTVDAVKRAVRFLETQDAPKIDGWYVGIIHPYCKYDLMKDPDWKNPHEYVYTENVYQNEIGELYGVRFVQSSRAKVFSGADLASDSRTLLVNGASVTSTKTVPFDGGAVKASALVGRMVSIGGTVTRVTANTTSQLTVEDDVTASDNDVIYPAEGGKGGADVYSTLILGDDAYGVTEITGGGLQHIVKQLGSSGSADPLDQRATCGWKATKTAEILVPQYMVRIETTATK